MNIFQRVLYELRYLRAEREHERLDEQRGWAKPLAYEQHAEKDCPVCYELDHGGPHEPKNGSRSYACEKCGWEPPEEYYYVDRGAHHDCTTSVGDKLLADPPAGFEGYPKYGPVHAGYEGDRNWEETHCCPFHGEFSFHNGC